MSRNERASYPAGRLLSRRGFIGAAGGVAASVAGLALYGCGPAQPASSRANAFPYASLTIEAKVNEVLDEMTDHEKLCQLFVTTAEDLCGLDVENESAIVADERLEERLGSFPIGGIIYFAKNLIDEEQASLMLDRTFDLSMSINGIPPLLCVDEEGGYIVRVAGREGFAAENVAEAPEIGATGDPSQAKQAADHIGEYLMELGFNTDLAPVCDIANNPESDTMERRSFGSDPDGVASMVAAQIEGFTESGILSCAKHFPGIGAAMGDSHDTRIFYEGTLEQLEATELVPFQAAIDTGVPLVMIGHLSLPTIVGDDTPACLSAKIASELLRNKMGFQGIAITDSLSMDAISEYYSFADAAVAALQAGCDLILTRTGFAEAYDGVRGALADGRLQWSQIDESLRRILRVKVGHFFDLGTDSPKA